MRVGYVLLVCLAGCAGSGETPAAEQAVLAVLEKFSPWAATDRNGRVVELRLESASVDDSALAKLHQFGELRTLSLYGAAVTDNGIKHLSQISQLESLGLGKTQVTDAGWEQLQHMTGLKWLWIGENPQITAGAVAALQVALPELTVYR
jgi:hypothetical protein